MKYLLASDLHGSLTGFEKLKKCIDIEKPDKIILLGDIFYHGIRNALPDEYAPAILLKELNLLKNKTVSLIGNCDSEVDISVAEFAFLPYLILDICGKTFFLSHGHKYNKANPPVINFFACIYGHEHIGFIDKGENIFACVGSVSCSKGGPNTYMTLDKNSLVLKDLQGNILDSLSLN